MGAASQLNEILTFYFFAPLSIRLIDYKKEKVFTGSKLNRKWKKLKLKIFPCIFDEIPL